MVPLRWCWEEIWKTQPLDVIVTCDDIHCWKTSLVVGSINVWEALHEWKSCWWNPVVFSRFQNVNSGAIVTSSIMSGISHCDVVLTDCSHAVVKHALMIIMALLTRTIQHGSSLLLGLSKSAGLYLYQNRNWPLMHFWLPWWVMQSHHITAVSGWCGSNNTLVLWCDPPPTTPASNAS